MKTVCEQNKLKCVLLMKVNFSEFIDFNLSVRSFWEKRENGAHPQHTTLPTIFRIYNLRKRLQKSPPLTSLLHHKLPLLPFSSAPEPEYLKPIKKCLEFIIILRGEREREHIKNLNALEKMWKMKRQYCMSWMV